MGWEDNGRQILKLPIQWLLPTSPLLTKAILLGQQGMNHDWPTPGMTISFLFARQLLFQSPLQLKVTMRLSLASEIYRETAGRAISSLIKRKPLSDFSPSILGWDTGVRM